jgi:hypothetical protein
MLQIIGLISTTKRSLTLYHAIIIMHILYLFGITVDFTQFYQETELRLILYWTTVSDTPALEVPVCNNNCYLIDLDNMHTSALLVCICMGNSPYIRLTGCVQ